MCTFQIQTVRSDIYLHEGMRVQPATNNELMYFSANVFCTFQRGSLGEWGPQNLTLLSLKTSLSTQSYF